MSNLKSLNPYTSLNSDNLVDSYLSLIDNEFLDIDQKKKERDLIVQAMKRNQQNRCDKKLEVSNILPFSK